jgi:hypothetical protein
LNKSSGDPKAGDTDSARFSDLKRQANPKRQNDPQGAQIEDLF